MSLANAAAMGGSVAEIAAGIKNKVLLQVLEAARAGRWLFAWWRAEGTAGHARPSGRGGLGLGLDRR